MKIALSILGLSGACLANAGNMGPINESHWNGFYLGANVGYWWSQSNPINTVGLPVFVNGSDPVGASNVANALASAGTHAISKSLEGVIGGGQVGYNRQVGNRVVIGLDLDINGLTDTTFNQNKAVTLVDFPAEVYTSTLSITKKVNYLGTVRGRVGFLCTPSLLLYGVGGLAYGGISLNESFVANESLSAFTYPTVVAQSNYNRTRAGWTIGGGGEWMFKPQWSAKIEYTYYDLGTLTSNMTLTQLNNLFIPPVPWGTANVHSSTQFAIGTVRIGINYHFS